MEETDNGEVTAIGVVEMMTRGEINSQIETAHRFPRSMERFKHHATEMACIDEETAASCIYRRPVGKDETGKMKFVEGMSIRMAEIVGAAYGNLRVYAMLLDQTERQVVARGMAMDLESNFASSSEIVESTVRRDGKPFDERMRIVVAKAALAKARRDATFQVVPRALARPIEQAVRKLLLGEAKSLDKRRAAVLAWIGTLEDKNHPSGKFDAKRVWKALGVEGPSDLGIEHIETLTGLRTAIKDGETSVDEAFPGETWKEVAKEVKAQSAKGQLEAEIKAITANSTEFKARLKDLTGCLFMSSVTEAAAQIALSQLRDAPEAR